MFAEIKLWLFLRLISLTRPKSYYRLRRLWKHQWLNRITEITPMDTPFLAMLPRVRSAHLYHEWITDRLETPTDRHRDGGTEPREPLDPVTGGPSDRGREGSG